MGAKGESSSPTHAVVLGDVPGTASTVDMATNDQTMGQTAGLTAKFCDARRPRGRERSADPPSDTGESESDFGTFNLTAQNYERARGNSLSEDDLNLHAQDELNDDEDLKPLTEQSSANKNVIQ